MVVLLVAFGRLCDVGLMVVAGILLQGFIGFYGGYGRYSPQ